MPFNSAEACALHLLHKCIENEIRTMGAPQLVSIFQSNNDELCHSRICPIRLHNSNELLHSGSALPISHPR